MKYWDVGTDENERYASCMKLLQQTCNMKFKYYKYKCISKLYERYEKFMIMLITVLQMRKKHPIQRALLEFSHPISQWHAPRLLVLLKHTIVGIQHNGSGISTGESSATSFLWLLVHCWGGFRPAQICQNNHTLKLNIVLSNGR